MLGHESNHSIKLIEHTFHEGTLSVGRGVASDEPHEGDIIKHGAV